MLMTEKYSYRNISRRKTREVSLGAFKVGGLNPILVQTMTNTLTTDVDATVLQVISCVKAGAEVIRISVPDVESSEGFRKIIKIIKERQIGVEELGFVVPIVADIHFHYKRGIEAVLNGADCIRINPGNIGTTERAIEIMKVCRDNNASIRVGVNVGSLEDRILQKYNGEPCPEALVESALDSVKVLEDNDFFNFKISVKASDVFLMMKAYRMLSLKCDYPLHLGVTEAGPAFAGTVKSAIGIGTLLSEGIGDTIRVSLSAQPEEEVRVGYEIMKSLKIRKKGVNIVSCPSCARQQFDVIGVVAQIEERTSKITKPITISMLGCVVNGLGEARESDIGVTGAGSGNHLIYLRGEPYLKASSENLVEEILKVVDLVISQ